MREVGQVSELLRYRPSETLASDEQPRESRQVSEFGRQSAVQPPSPKGGDRCDALRGSC